MNKLHQVVLITGAGKGVGRALTEALAAAGATVAANDISPINVEEVVAGILARGGKARAYVEDVAKKVAVQALIKNVEDDLGRIDALIVHAAVEPHTPLLDIDEWDWHRTLDVNLTGAFLMIQSVGRVMRASSPKGEKGRGLIMVIVPQAGSEVQDDAAAYTSSMAGLRELAHAAERELSPFGIQVHVIENRGAEKTMEAVMSFFEEARR